MSLAKVALQDLAHADKHTSELKTWEITAPTGYEPYAAAVLLHHVYGAIEATIERSLKIFDGASPDGVDSHVQLLEQASRAVEGVRGVILPHDDAVDELRRFRHRFRKRYDVDIEPALLQPVIKAAVTSWPRIRAHLDGFAAFVEECAKVAK